MLRMNAISVYDVSKSVKDDNLFSHLSFGLEEGEKLGIIGKNGAGKSTLLKVLDGTIPADEGLISINNKFKIGRLDQDVLFPEGCTLEQYFRLYEDERIEILNRFECGETNLSHKVEELQIWELEERYRRFLSELGVNLGLETKMNTLSGGMKKKAAIARLLAMDIQIMLLDEPTNHLDIPAIEWLEEYLFAKNCTVILVTHDRYFLDKICSRILEIDKRQVYFYEGGYTEFLRRREERISAMQKEQDRLVNILRRELEWLKRGPQARTGKDSGRKKRIEEMKEMQTSEEDAPHSFSSIQRRLGKKILKLDNISVTRGINTVIKDFSLEFIKGQRFGVIGPNGSGKTTLLEVITSNLVPQSGTVDTGINTVFGYYDQMSDKLPLNKTPLEFFSDISENIVLANDYSVSPARFLELFGFPSTFHRQPIGILSGGEKRRLNLLSTLVKNPNFLVFDEPTNDLDIDTLRRLEQYVLDFEGCVICVSHDRAFLDRTCNELIVMPHAQRFEGNYSDWHEKQLKEEEVKKTSAKKQSTQSKQQNREKKGLSFKEQKEFEALENTIEETEARISELENLFSNGTQDRDGSMQKEYSSLKNNLEKYYERWEELTSLM